MYLPSYSFTVTKRFRVESILHIINKETKSGEKKNPNLNFIVTGLQQPKKALN
jgi:hypothetical protein